MTASKLIYHFYQQQQQLEKIPKQHQPPMLGITLDDIDLEDNEEPPLNDLRRAQGSTGGRIRQGHLGHCWSDLHHHSELLINVDPALNKREQRAQRPLDDAEHRRGRSAWAQRPAADFSKTCQTITKIRTPNL